ncbi:MAG: hypothetical protein KDH92_07470 [Chloroflexi bacterium]|nr:hypothetical protein [Chloroflexota bacterium]
MGKLLQAGLVAFVIMAVVSMLFYGVLMVDQFAVWEAEVARAAPMMPLGFVGMLIFSLSMAAIYPKGYQGGDPLQEGARFGLRVGGLLAGLVVMFYSFYEFQLAGSVIDIVFNVLLLAVMGAAIGKVYGSGAGA